MDSVRRSALPPVERTVVSACLGGTPCRYNAAARPDPEVKDWVAQGEVIPLCAEVLGGMSTPRPAAEIVGGEGADVLDGQARVIDATGADVTDEFVRGSRRAADIAVEAGATRAILQARSPSCGCTTIYDGTQTGVVRQGAGVFAAELRRRGLTVEERRGQRGA